MPLRPLRASDLPALSDWLPRTAAELGCDRWADEQALRGALATAGKLLYSDERGEAFVAYATHTPLPHSARIDLLAVAPGRRRLGSGSRAALALERRLARSIERVYVLVPSRLGLALYFWLRLGYRPLTQRDWPAAPDTDTSAWMMRELR
jgi:ribosomal protein S18 acetylase RimI-like enzyme